MEEYLSRTEHSLGIQNDLNRIRELPWSDYISLEKLSFVPLKSGVLVLFNKNRECISYTTRNEKHIAVSTSENLLNRAIELLSDKQCRFSETAYIKYVEIADRNERFTTRTDIKHLAARIRTPIEKIENVVDDDSPLVRHKKENIELMKHKLS